MYINKKELLAEVKKCKAEGKPSDKLFHMFWLISDGVNRRLYYRRQEDREDAKSHAFMKLCYVWKGFNDELYSDPFAYYSEIAKRAMAESWNQTNKNRDWLDINDIVRL